MKLNETQREMSENPVIDQNGGLVCSSASQHLLNELTTLICQKVANKSVQNKIAFLLECQFEVEQELLIACNFNLYKTTSVEILKVMAEECQIT
jgi:hypothetical protein